MRADDLRFDELLTFRDGSIDFQGRRLALHSMDAFAQFRRDLFEMVGARQACRILICYGYFWGQVDAVVMKWVFSWSNGVELVKAGAHLQQHPEFAWMKDILHDMDARPWTVFSAR